jgi:hypothetical protein
MPITKQITETSTRTVTILTLQEYADSTIPEEYRQPLKTIHEALSIHGWECNPMPDDYKPVCCGKEVECRSFLGGAYLAHCRDCGRFVLDITGPSFGNAYVSFPDGEQVDLETDIEHRWIAAIEIRTGRAA